MLRSFSWSIALAVVGVVLAGLYDGWEGAGLVTLLIVLEVSISFDNAVVNATVLRRMSLRWQTIFLTVGVIIAVFGMRLVFPVLVVSAASGLSPWDAFVLALQSGDPETPGTYGYILGQAHPAIAAFGGVFLLMLFLDFVFEDREIRWLRPIEAALARVGRLQAASAIVAIAVLLLAGTVLADDASRVTVLVAGLIGLGAYLLVNGLGRLVGRGIAAETPTEEAGGGGARRIAPAVGKAAFVLFCYLELLDAAFSVDGVVGAFAITSDPILIAIGLGVGAFFIRSITVRLVRRGTLGELRYLEHGAMWAVGALAVILVLSIRFEVPEWVTGLIGFVIIAAGFATSLLANRRDRLAVATAGPGEDD